MERNAWSHLLDGSAESCGDGFLRLSRIGFGHEKSIGKPGERKEDLKNSKTKEAFKAGKVKETFEAEKVVNAC